MKLITILKSEHEQINIMLEVLRLISIHLKADQPVDVSHTDRIVRFLQDYADGLHHKKEEELLFKVMEKYLPEQSGEMVGELQADHTLASMLVDSLEVASESYLLGETGAGTEFADIVDGYRTLLSHHICREDNILYPMAKKNLSTAVKKEIKKNYKKIQTESGGDEAEQDCLKILDELASAFSVTIDSNGIHGN